MFSSLKTSFIFVAVLSAIASSAVPVVKRIPGDFPFKSRMFLIDPTRNECNIPATPDSLVIQVSRKLNFKPFTGGAAENGLCGPTAVVFDRAGRQTDVQIVGLCNACEDIDFQASAGVFKALGADPSRTLEGLEFTQ